ncbi:MAG: hypothetical protein ACRC42_02190 [Mycoplasma sp.]
MFLKRLKIEEKGYKYLFIVYTFSWIAPMLLRAYSGTMQNAIDIDFTWIVLASYGIIGIFARTFADFFNFKFKKRKMFLYASGIIQLALYIPIIILPNTTTSLLQSIGVGIGASCIGSFQLLFKEQYNRKNTFLTVSILSIPPILADLLTAPLQSIVISIAKVDKATDPEILKYLWVIGIIFAFAAFIMVFFVKEKQKKFDIKSDNYFKFSTDGVNFVILCSLGVFITFIKFANSGSVGTLHLQTLGDISGFDTTSFEGYLSVIFSVFQLIGGVIVGTYLVKRFSNITIFLMGSILWFTYTIGAMFTTHPVGYFVLHSMNGLAYGILYNFILGTILSSSFKTKKITPMGIYQSLLAGGIALSTSFTQLIRNNLKLGDYYISNIIIDSIILGAIVIMFGLYWYYNKRIDPFKQNLYRMSI